MCKTSFFLGFFLAVEQIHKVTEVIHSQPVQSLETRPAKVQVARITLPGGSKLQLNTMIKGWPRVHTHQIHVGSPVIRSNIWGIQRKNVITRPYLSLRNSTHDVPRTLKTKGAAGKMGTNMVTEGLSELRKDIKGPPRMGDTTRVSQRDKNNFKPKVLRKHRRFHIQTRKRLKFQKVRRNTD